MKKKPIWAWMVVWTDEGAKEYGVTGNRIVFLETAQVFKVKCSCKPHKGWHYGGAYAIFPSRQEAVAWVDGNDYFKVVRVCITNGE
jgi:hypothetical protein